VKGLPIWAIVKQDKKVFATKYIDGMDTTSFVIGGGWVEADELQALLTTSTRGNLK
jgi:hypothetical protein